MSRIVPWSRGLVYTFGPRRLPGLHGDKLGPGVQRRNNARPHAQPPTLPTLPGLATGPDQAAHRSTGTSSPQTPPPDLPVLTPPPDLSALTPLLTSLLACRAPALPLHQLDHKSVHWLLRQLEARGAANAALCLLWSLPPASRPAPVVTRVMQVCLGQGSDAGPGAVLKVWRQLRLEGLEADATCFNTVITAAGRAQRWGVVRSVLEDMRREGVARDVFTYAAVLSNCRDAQHAQRWFDGMAAHGVQPNVRHYTALINCQRRWGSAGDALRTFEAMGRAGIVPDGPAYTAAIAAAARLADWQRAWALLSDARRGGGAAPVRAWNGVICACSRAGRLDRAREAAARMRAAGVAPTAATYNALIGACRAPGQYATAREYEREMARAGLPADDFTLSALFGACAADGQWEAALDAMRAARATGRRPGVQAHNALLRTLAGGAQWRHARAVLEGMAGGEGPAPDAASFAALILALERGGKYEEAWEAYNQLQARGLKPTSDTLCALLRACEAGQQWERAIDLFNQLKAQAQAELPPSGMALRSILYSMPLLMHALPPSLVATARAAVESGRKTRALLD
uniref:Pentatricopeptide repeat-containing protein-mitochondrial domain-containing protein n=2 Tax=Auxenochlorella protothecoides TaxID=3075 RepID=A0A1D2AGP0_AUXPR